jgi:mono/diheme cytochrome c family protein/glucose/arabinose dehydrogenase
MDRCDKEPKKPPVCPLIRSMKILPGIAFVLCLSTSFLRAQIGDKAGEAQAAQVPAELIPPASPLTPEEERKTFQVAPGFRVELVAAEPLVGDPVAMAFGPDGRLWIVEMRSYMPDLDGNHEDQPTGRVVVLSDTDGDGRMDQSDVFLDGLIMPRALMLVRDGVLIGAPPKLWYCRDTDGDGKADKQEEVAGDYGVQVDPKRPELANPERAPNSLLWGLDNWIYSGAYTAKFRWNNGVWERGTTTFRGQWGLSQDDWGHLFHNSNSDQLRGDLVPTHYLGRNPFHQRAAGGNVKVSAAQLVWPIRVNPGINRGYRPEMLRDFKLKEFTAACAPWIYRGDLFPAEFYGNAFICEPAGNLIKRNILTAERGTLTAREAYAQHEFLASTDERFRPVNLTTGPEGALYVVDFYRGVIQHRISLTTYLRQQSEARGLAQPTGLGRIWRIAPEESRLTARPQFDKETPAQWVAHLSHSNAWWRETAQRLLVEHGDASVIPALEALVTAGKAPLGRLHALWTLDGLRAVRWPVVNRALDDADPRVRVAAVRVSEVFLIGNERGDLLKKWTSLAAAEASAEGQLQIALSLGEARDAACDLTMATLCRRAGDHAFVRDAVLSGLVSRELELIETLLADPAWQAREAPSDQLLIGLARCVLAERKPGRVERLLELLAASPKKTTLLAGLAAHPSITDKHPVKLPVEPAALAKLGGGKTADAALARFAPLLTWPGKPGAAPTVPMIPLTAEQQARFETGKQLYTAVCAACHQPHGYGMDGLAPPLADSEWVLGSIERLGRIVLNGVRGPIKVKGVSYALDMPGMGVFDDQQLASILTYLRREWGHEAAPVEPATIQQLRATVAQRQDAWTAPELLKFPE